MSNDLAALIGWYFLPNFVTGLVQSAFYSIWIRAGEPKPQPGSRAFVSHRRKIQILVVLAYLLVTIYQADIDIRNTPDFYRDLGVEHGVDERGLQSRFRRLTVAHHPDKITENHSRAEAYYVHLKFCRDLLLDPAKRFAYDRIGPDILNWQHKTTISDYIYVGLRNLTAYYVGTASVLVVLSVMGYMQQAAYWRYLALATLFTFELHILTSPTPPRLLTSLLNPLLQNLHLRTPYLPYQALLLLRKLILTLFIAFSQIGPLLTQPITPSPPTEKQISQHQLNRLAQLSADVQKEANMLMGLEMSPFVGDEEGKGRLRTGLRRFLVDNTVRSQGEVRDAVGRVLERRRRGVPHGAVGAR